MQSSTPTNSKRKSPGAIDHGFLPIPVSFESELRLFTPAALKVYLTLRLRTIFEDHVAITTKALAHIVRMTPSTTKRAIDWLADPSSRDESADARGLAAYIRVEQEEEHADSMRKVQTIYIEGWKHPRQTIAATKRTTPRSRGGEDSN